MHKNVRKYASAGIVAAFPILLAASSLAQYSGTPDPASSQTPAGQNPSQPNSQAPDQTQPAPPAQQDPPSVVARIGEVQGNVSFMASGSSDWSAGVNNYPMINGDRLFCDAGAQAEIGTGSTDLRLWQNTDVTLTNLNDQLEQIGLANGSLRVRIYSINPGATVEIDTPNGAAVINQPGDYRFDVTAASGTAAPGSDAVVNAGSVDLYGPDGSSQQLHAGQAVQMTGTAQLQLAFMSLPAFDALDQWSIDRDHDILNSQTAQYVNPETPGSSDLDANGSWATTPDYGPIWTPTTVTAGWAPYSVGSWAYVAPWGYTWIDAAPWGYAPFHYGRWVIYNGRWGWVPGPRPVVPVYSPALVAWVGGPHIGVGIGVAAWFPLGVGEPFVPWYHASPYYTRRVNVTNVNVTYIHNTTVVNNYNNFIANTRTVNNVSQLNTTNIQYANRARVTAMPETAMTAGRPVSRSSVQLTPAVRQQLATAPVHTAPSAAAPPQSTLAARANVKAPTTRPTLVTAHQSVPANPAHSQATEARVTTATTPNRTAYQPQSQYQSRPQYQPQPYNSTTYSHTQQSAPRPQAPPAPRQQPQPKPHSQGAPKEEKPK